MAEVWLLWLWYNDYDELLLVVCSSEAIAMERASEYELINHGAEGIDWPKGVSRSTGYEYSIAKMTVDAVYEMVKMTHARALEFGITDDYVVVSRGIMPKMLWHTAMGRVIFVYSAEAKPDEIYAMLRKNYEEYLPSIGDKLS